MIRSHARSVPVSLPGSCFSSCDYVPGRYTAAQFDQYGIRPPPWLARAHPRRAASYLAGRHCARSALLQLTGRAEQLPADSGGRPRWPDSVVGSLTHTGTCAAAIVGRRSDFAALGLDIEGIFTCPANGRLENKLLSAPEKSRLACARLPRDILLTLLFSAKESLYKALGPANGAVADFHAWEYLGHDARQLWFRLRDGHSPGERQLGVTYRLFGQQVLTCCSIAAVEAADWPGNQ